MSSPSSSDHCILYQIDCCKASSGKTVFATKRRVRWRFGTSNPEAMKSGATGVDCRGCEHEISFTWSIASGKRLLVQDNREIHYSQGKRAEGKFTFVWVDNFKNSFTLIAYAAPPVKATHRQHGKQFELLVNGISFDSLPRIYELGMGMRNPSRAVASSTAASYAYPSSKAERRAYVDRRTVQDEMTWARSMHSMETKRKMNADFSNDRNGSAFVQPSPRQGTSPVTVNAPVEDLLSAEPQKDLLADTTNHFVQTPAVHPVYDEFSPTNSQNNNNMEAVWSSIMDAYDNGHQVADHPAPAPVQYQQPAFTHTATSVETIQSSMQNLSVNTAVEASKPAVVSPTEVTAMDAMKNLVNLDDINEPVFTSYKPKQEANPWTGKENVSLSDLKKDTKTASSKKEVMRTYNNVPTHAAPGSLVVYGQGQMGMQGPPPLSFGYRY